MTTVSKYKCPRCSDMGWVVYKKNINGCDYDYCRECECGLIKKKISDSNLAFANIPEKYRNLLLCHFETKWYGKDKEGVEKIKKVFQHYIGNYFQLEPGRGLYLFSSTKGTGKTRAACIIANELIKKGIVVKFATSGRILDEIKSTYNGESNYTESKLIDDLTSADVLIIDDFGVERGNDWRNEKFYNIINNRYITLRPTIFTSNYNLNDLRSMNYDKRIISRVAESCYMIPFPGQSVRDNKEQENQIEIKKWIGMEN